MTEINKSSNVSEVVGISELVIGSNFLTETKERDKITCFFCGNESESVAFTESGEGVCKACRKRSKVPKPIKVEVRVSKEEAALLDSLIVEGRRTTNIILRRINKVVDGYRYCAVLEEKCSECDKNIKKGYMRYRDREFICEKCFENLWKVKKEYRSTIKTNRVPEYFDATKLTNLSSTYCTGFIDHAIELTTAYCKKVKDRWTEIDRKQAVVDKLMTNPNYDVEDVRRKCRDLRRLRIKIKFPTITRDTIRVWNNCLRLNTKNMKLGISTFTKGKMMYMNIRSDEYLNHLKYIYTVLKTSTHGSMLQKKCYKKCSKYFIGFVLPVCHPPNVVNKMSMRGIDDGDTVVSITLGATHPAVATVWRGSKLVDTRFFGDSSFLDKRRRFSMLSIKRGSKSETNALKRKGIYRFERTKEFIHKHRSLLNKTKHKHSVGDRESNWVLRYQHDLSREVVSYVLGFKSPYVVFRNYSGLSNCTWSKDQNRFRKYLALSQLSKLIQHKLQLGGIPHKLINYGSVNIVACSRCGSVSNDVSVVGSILNPNYAVTKSSSNGSNGSNDNNDANVEYTKGFRKLFSGRMNLSKEFVCDDCGYRANFLFNDCVNLYKHATSPQ